MTPQRRDRLRQKLEELIGEEEAATLMEHLPPDRWDELARRKDLEPFVTKAELEELRRTMATKKDLEELRRTMATKDDLAALQQATKDDLAALQQATKDDLAQLEARMDLKLESMGHRLEALFRERVDHSTRVTVFAVLTAMLTSTGLALGVAMIGA